MPPSETSSINGEKRSNLHARIQPPRRETKTGRNADMPLPFDATLKDLVRQYSDDYRRQLNLADVAPLAPLNVELSTVTAATDIVLGYGDPPTLVVDLNFQASRAEDLMARLLLYNALLYHRYRAPVHSVLVLLRPAADDPALTGQLRYQVRSRKSKMNFAFEVVRLWNRPVRRMLTGGLGTLPLVPLCRMPANVSLEEALPGLIRRMEERVSQETTSARATQLLTAAFVLTGLRLSRDVTLQLFQGVRAMRESTTYQYILEEGCIEEARKLILRLGRQRFGPPSETVTAVLSGMTDLERLERISDRLLVVSNWQELLDTP
jgi:predicted transposase YdaD